MRGHPWEVGFQAYNSDMFSSILGLGPGLNKFGIFSVRFGPAPRPGLRAPGGGGSRNFWRYSQSGNPLGVQHIVFNAQQEIELTETWKPFWNDLKNVERFMRLKERRDRYVHTCLLNGPFASFTNSFERWSDTLYSHRWHEVVRFCSWTDFYASWQARSTKPSMAEVRRSTARKTRAATTLLTSSSWLGPSKILYFRRQYPA